MVDPIGTKPVTVSGRVVAPVMKAAAPAAVDAARGTDPQLAAATRDAAATPPVDTDRVARIRSAIRNGTFPIYPATIADRLLALKLEWNPHDAK